MKMSHEETEKRSNRTKIRKNPYLYLEIIGFFVIISSNLSKKLKVIYFKKSAEIVKLKPNRIISIATMERNLLAVFLEAFHVFFAAHSVTQSG